jgi:glycosyltransferase involved in cell wall biosynthesis
MRIAQVAPLWERVPPDKYGGTERVIHNLVEGLVDRGHDVTLFASGDSCTRAQLIAVVPRHLRAEGIAWDNHLFPLMSFAAAFERAEEFDVIHTHLNTPTDFAIFPLSHLVKTPVVTTVHCRFPGVDGSADQRALLQKYHDHPYVTISNAQRTMPELNVVATVYNGIDLDAYPFSETTEDYVLWLGRICKDKGTGEAIEAARLSDVRLLLAGKLDIHNPAYMAYYEREVISRVDGDRVLYLGEVDQRFSARLMRGARALLNPIRWPEPFGLVMAEAMACGTPVISFPIGAAPELIRDGRTGFLVNSVEEMAEAITRIGHIDRRECRRHVEQNFSADTMVGKYERVYRRLTLAPETVATQLVS